MVPWQIHKQIITSTLASYAKSSVSNRNATHVQDILELKKT